MDRTFADGGPVKGAIPVAPNMQQHSINGSGEQLAPQPVTFPGVVMFHGTLDTQIKKPGTFYKTITYPEIVTMAQKPATEAKDRAPAIIPSTYNAHDGRSHDAQRERGNYVMLCGDIDVGRVPLAAVLNATAAIIGSTTAFLVYSSSSATEEVPKWRIIIPLADELPGDEYSGIQLALFSLYADHGITCDGALARTGQPVFLPNVRPDRRWEDGSPIHHVWHENVGQLLQVDASCAIVERATRLYREEQAERERVAAEAALRRASRPQRAPDGRLNPTQWFNQNHGVEEMLLQCGYQRHPKLGWRSPHQQSGSFATAITDDGESFISLSGSDRDAGVGVVSKSGAAIYGDAFDLYLHYEHGGDHAAAWAAIRRNMPREKQPKQADPSAGEIFGADELLEPKSEKAGEKAEEKKRGKPKKSSHDDYPFIVNSKGVPAAIIANVAIMLRGHPEWQDVLAFDKLAGKMLLQNPLPDIEGKKPNQFTPRQIDDSDIIKATEWFQHNDFYTMKKETVFDGMTVTALDNAFDPLEDKLRSLKWDGVLRLEDWLLSYCGAEVTHTQPEAYIRAAGLRWMISGVARALRPGCKVDTAMVLVGLQGIGKSTVGKILAYDEWFADSLPPVHSKDASDYLRGKWIVEFGEMATASRSDVEEFKAFMTRQHEKFRPAYGRNEIEYPRRCVFFGTTNKDAFLKDDTGNRRFWPVVVTQVDREALLRDRDQLWAEAVHLFDKGEQWHLTDSEVEMAAVQQATFVIVDERAELLREKLKNYTKVTALQALALLEMKNEKREQMDVTSMLKYLGWGKDRTNAKKFWIRSVTTSADGGGHNSQGGGHGDDESF